MSALGLDIVSVLERFGITGFALYLVYDLAKNSMVEVRKSIDNNTEVLTRLIEKLNNS